MIEYSSTSLFLAEPGVPVWQETLFPQEVNQEHRVRMVNKPAAQAAGADPSR